MRQNSQQNQGTFQERTQVTFNPNNQLTSSQFCTRNTRQQRIQKRPYDNNPNSQSSRMDLGSQQINDSQSSRKDSSIILNLASITNRVKNTFIGWTNAFIFGSQKSQVSQDQKSRVPGLTQSQMVIDEQREEIDLNESICLKESPMEQLQNISINMPRDLFNKKQFSNDKQVKNDGSTRISQPEYSLEMLINNEDSNNNNRNNQISNSNNLNRLNLTAMERITFDNQHLALRNQQNRQIPSENKKSVWEIYNIEDNQALKAVPMRQRKHKFLNACHKIIQGKKQKVVTRDAMMAYYLSNKNQFGKKSLRLPIFTKDQKYIHEFIGLRRKLKDDRPTNINESKKRKVFDNDFSQRGVLQLNNNQELDEQILKQRVERDVLKVMTLQERERFLKGQAMSKRRAYEANDRSIEDKFIRDQAADIQQKMQAKQAAEQQKELTELLLQESKKSCEQQTQQMRYLEKRIKDMNKQHQEQMEEQKRIQEEQTNQLIQRVLKEMGDKVNEVKSQIDNIQMSQQSSQQWSQQTQDANKAMTDIMKNISDQVSNIGLEQKQLKEVVKKIEENNSSVGSVTHQSPDKITSFGSIQYQPLKQMQTEEGKKENKDPVKDPKKSLSFGNESSYDKKVSNSSFVSEELSTPISSEKQTQDMKIEEIKKPEETKQPQFIIKPPAIPVFNFKNNLSEQVSQQKPTTFPFPCAINQQQNQQQATQPAQQPLQPITNITPISNPFLQGVNSQQLANNPFINPQSAKPNPFNQSNAAVKPHPFQLNTTPNPNNPFNKPPQANATPLQNNGVPNPFQNAANAAPKITPFQSPLNAGNNNNNNNSGGMPNPFQKLNQPSNFPFQTQQQQQQTPSQLNNPFASKNPTPVNPFANNNSNNNMQSQQKPVPSFLNNSFNTQKPNPLQPQQQINNPFNSQSQSSFNNNNGNNSMQSQSQPQSNNTSGMAVFNIGVNKNKQQNEINEDLMFAPAPSRVMYKAKRNF